MCKKGTGLRRKINFTIGSSSFIAATLCSNFLEELIKYSKAWLTLFKHVKLNSVEVITKKCKKNTHLSIKYSSNSEQTPTEQLESKLSKKNWKKTGTESKRTLW